MQEYKDIMIQNCLDKSHQALSDAEYGLKDSRTEIVLNRLYYAVFYCVLALAYRDNFSTSKHTQLMGWFNKKFIHEEKVFDKRLSEIYRAAHMNRQEADYDISNLTVTNPNQLKDHLADVKYFIDTVEKHIMGD